MYDRNLIDYLPLFIQRIREIKAIMNTEQSEMVSVWDKFEDAFSNQFIKEATEYGVSRWEKILKIVPKATDSLDDRKFTVLTRINEKLPYTMTTLHQQLKSLCGENGYSINLQNEDYTLIVRVSLTTKNSINDVDALLHRVVPANMVIDLSLKYNQHDTLKQFTHANLKVYTHHQVRNEVLPNAVYRKL